MIDQFPKILFSMGLGLKEDLKNGKFSEKLRQQFTNNNVPLPQSVTIQVQEEYGTWEIHDEGGDILHVIKKEGDCLNVYSASLEYYLGKFRNRLASVGDKLKWGDTPVTKLDGQVMQISDEFSGLREKLEVFVGGYFFYDHHKENVSALFIEEYPFKYSSSNPECHDLPDKYRDLLDKMFEEWRKQDTVRPLEDQGYPVEYFSHLLSHEKGESFLGLDESELRKRYSAHYCTLGEMVFFMFSWRFLLRIAQQYGWGAVFEQHDASSDKTVDVSLNKIVTTKPKKPKPLWAMEEWQTCHTRERSWFNYINAEHTEEKDKNIVELWTEVTKEVDKYTDDINPWMQDWRTLLLIAKEPDQDGNHMILPSFTALIRFAGHVASYLKMDQKDQDELKRLAAKCTKIEELVKIDSLLKQIAWSFLRIEPVKSDSKLTAKHLLEHLHCLARFPIYPYFYWLYMDPVPKSHLVLPVWRSHRPPIKVPVFRCMPESREECIRFKNYTDLETTIAMIALTGLRPLEGLDWTVPSSHDGKSMNLGEERIQAIWKYYRLLAGPPVDSSYYREIERKREDLGAMIAYATTVSRDVIWRHWTAQRLSQASLAVYRCKRILEQGGDKGELLSILESLDRNIAVLKKGRPPDQAADVCSLATVFSILNDGFQESTVNLIFESPESLPLIKAPMFHVRHILRILIDNAVEAIQSSGKGKEVRITVSEVGSQFIEVEVCDDGPGIPEELKEKLLREPIEPESEEKSGVGLLIARGTALQYRGDLARREMDTGACFVLKLPVT